MNKKLTIWAGIILVAILLGVGAYFIYNGYHKTGSNNNTQQNVIAGTVNVQNSTFTPGTITINKGDTVTWKNNDTMIHRVVADDGSFDLGDMVNNGTSKRTFDIIGTYNYHCAIHTFMTGTVIVK